MSNAIFPTLPGLTWNVTKQPSFATNIQKSVSGKENRISLQNSPMYTFKMTYEFLRDLPNVGVPSAPYNELQQLMGFFVRMKGSYDSFLFSDPVDNLVTEQTFGLGDGEETVFQLIRTWGGATDIVQNLNGTPTIYIDDVEINVSEYTISNGAVTFDTAPDEDAVLTWTGHYYFRCRFNMDAAEFNNFMHNLWELKRCELFGSLLNKI